MLKFNEYAQDMIKSLSSNDLGVMNGKKILAMETPVFGDLVPEDLTLSPPPANDSPETINELQYMSNYTRNIKPEQIDFIAKTDNDIFTPFLKYAWNNMMQVNKKSIRALMQQSAKFERHFKHMYKRPRPEMLAPMLGIDIFVQPSETAKTPSYPSGHATQAMIAALALSYDYPREQEGLIKVAYQIAEARVEAGFHYPSDRDAGFAIAFQLYDHIQWDILQKQTVKEM
jgi:hypothetical protein|tara:strand:+ start:323 stop:1009 length:687 start_codon:yes stop_codon:yes gene_type:complete